MIKYKKLTRSMFTELTKLGINTREWGYTKNNSEQLFLVNIKTGEEKIIDKKENNLKF